MCALRSKFCLTLVLALMPFSAFAFDITTDLLVWKASEEPSLLWASVLKEGPGREEILEGETLSFDWDIGFRVGIGQIFDCDCLNLQLYWTSFCDRAKKNLPKKGELIASQFFGGFLNQDISESAEIQLKLKYNMVDGQLGRNFCISECFSLWPFIGIKGGWIDQSIHSEWQNITEQLTTFSSTENLTNDFWGIGPSVGVKSRWELCCPFSLFGDFEIAFLWGTLKNKDLYENSQSIVINTNTKNSHLGSLMLRAFVGFAWETDIFQCAHFIARLGYESQIWFSLNQFTTFQQLPVHGDLTLQGGTLNLIFGF